MTILVENIASCATEDQLRSMFESYGTVESVYFIKDKHTGIRNGQAYVSMLSDDEAEQAIVGLQGADFEGQQLRLRRVDDADFPSGDFW